MPTAFPDIRTDLFSFFILLGAVQGFFLSYFFLTNSKGRRFPNIFLGILLICMSLVMTDVWLGYTNYMFRVIWFVDFTEPVNLLLAPLTFLFIKTSVNQKFNKKDLFHFLPALIYFIYMCLLIYPQSIEYKYNCNIDAFHPEMENIPAKIYGERWMFFLKWHINDLTVISLVIYNTLGFNFLNGAFKKRGLDFFNFQKSDLSWYRKFLIELLCITLVLVITRFIFKHDLGDHLVAAFISLAIYGTSFLVFSQSQIFKADSTKPNKKYEKSSLTPEIQNSAIPRLEEYMKTEKPFLDSSFSLPSLAKKLGLSTHHLSQILNDELRQSFFDFTASYRIAEAQELLRSADHMHIKIEEIGQMTGYNSKSAFNTSFRKITGVTPSEYRKEHLTRSTD